MAPSARRKSRKKKLFIFSLNLVFFLRKVEIRSYKN